MKAASKGQPLVPQMTARFCSTVLRFQAEERDHHRVILVSPRRFSSSTTGIGRRVPALDAVLEAHPGDDDLVNDQIWLGSASRRS